MKKQVLAISVTFLCLMVSGQITFEPGYFITEENDTIQCLIKNVEWLNNPTSFEYKLLSNSEVEIASIRNVKEFGINTYLKYIKDSVLIDRSSELLALVSKKRSPEFQEEVLFLKVLVEGKATLYEYNDEDLLRFFYSINNSEIQQLVYKSYLTGDNNLNENNYFIQQLINDLKSENLRQRDYENLEYKEKDLIDIFSKYNSYGNPENIVSKNKSKKDLINLNFRPGINLSGLWIYNTLESFRNTNFGFNLGYRLGLEAEFIMPFNKNKWAIIFEPTYQNYKSKKTTTYNTTKINYQSIEMPVGLRYKIFLSKKSVIFINSSFIFDWNFNSTLKFEVGDGLEINTRNNFAFGLGYNYHDRISIEARMHSPRELFGNYAYWYSSYETYSLILGYTLF